MRDVFVYFGSSLEFDIGNELTTAISEEITGTMVSLDDYVAALSQQDVPKVSSSMLESSLTMVRA